MYLTVKKGDRLPTVALAQARLVENGESKLVVDGVFGPKTLAAVRHFQAQADLVQTGKVDQGTWAALTRSHPLKVVDVIDASDIAILLDDRPYLDDGHANIVVSWGQSRGTMVLIDRLVASYPCRSVALLRFDGHGSPGNQRVAGGGRGVFQSSAFAAGHFKNQTARRYYGKLAGIMKPYGSVELHGCRIGAGAQGRSLLASLADAFGVPVSAGITYQYGEDMSDRFEGPTVTHCPRSVPLRAWATRTFASCEW